MGTIDVPTLDALSTLASSRTRRPLPEGYAVVGKIFGEDRLAGLLGARRPRRFRHDKAIFPIPALDRFHNIAIGGQRRAVYFPFWPFWVFLRSTSSRVEFFPKNGTPVGTGRRKRGKERKTTGAPRGREIWERYSL